MNKPKVIKVYMKHYVLAVWNILKYMIHHK